MQAEEFKPPVGGLTTMPLSEKAINGKLQKTNGELILRGRQSMGTRWYEYQLSFSDGLLLWVGPYKLLAERLQNSCGITSIDMFKNLRMLESELKVQLKKSHPVGLHWKVVLGVRLDADDNFLLEPCTVHVGYLLCLCTAFSWLIRGFYRPFEAL